MPETSLARFWIGAAVPCLLGALIYANGLDGPFVFDDTQNIRDNPQIHLESISPGALWGIVVDSPKRPVALLSFALNHRFGGLEVRGYHLVNVAIHLINAVLVYWLAFALLARDPSVRKRAQISAALVTACIFVAHPLQTQSVTYIVQRMNSLAVLFYISAMLLYLRGRRTDDRRRWVYWGGAGFAWLLALGSKEIAITLPVTLFLYEWLFERDSTTERLRGGRWLALGAAATMAAGTWALWIGGTLDYTHRSFGMAERVLTELRVVVAYLGLLVAPLPSFQSLIHEVPISRSLLDPPTTLLCGIAIAAAIAAAITFATRSRLVAFGVLFFFANLVLESSILPLEIMYEHRVYLPLVGFALVCGRLAAAGGTRWPVRTAVVATCAIAALGAATVARNAVWSDEIRLWSDTAKKSPGNARSLNNLGAALERAGRLDEAVVQLARSIALDPGYARGHNNLGIALHRLSRTDEAIEHYREAIQISPRYADAHRNLGSALASSGRHEDAITAYRRSIRLAPGVAISHYGLAVSHARLGDLESAAAAIEKTLLADPDHAEALRVQRALRSPANPHVLPAT